MKTDFKQTNYHFSFTVHVHNTPEKVWEVLTDVDRWKIWDTELKEAKLNGNFTEGSNGELIPKKGPKLNFYISEIMPNESYTFITKMPVGQLVIKRILEKTDDGVKFTDDIQFTGFLKKVFGLALGGGFKAVLPKVMENFKRLAEAE